MSYTDLEAAKDELRTGISLGEAALARATTKRAERVRLETRLAELEGKLAGIELAMSYAPERPTVEEEVEAALGGILVTDYPSEGAMGWTQAARFLYRDAEGLSEERHVSLYERRTCQNGSEVVVGFDHLREGIRMFRLDRIVAYDSSHLVLASSYAFRAPEAD